MKTLYSANIKPLIKRVFPFIKFRWLIYETCSNSKPYFYYKFTRVVSKRDLSQEINLNSSNKLVIESINELNKDTLIKLAKKDYNKIDRNWWDRYYKENYNGFIAKLKDEIIGYVWWVNSDMKKPREVFFNNIKLEKGDTYGFNFFIVPQYRGDGNSVEFLNKVFFELKKLGYSSNFGFVDVHNLSARWTYRIVGFKDIKTSTSYVFLNLIAYHNKAIFVKNFLKHPYYQSGYRLLLSLR